MNEYSFKKKHYFYLLYDVPNQKKIEQVNANPRIKCKEQLVILRMKTFNTGISPQLLGITLDCINHFCVYPGKTISISC